METHIIPFNEVEKMAQAVAKSGLFGMTTPEQALSLMLLAQAEKIHPMTAARDYNIIKGRPALKADAMLARFQNAGGVVKWVTHTDKKVAAYFSHPSCPDPVLIDWDIDRAKQAGVFGKDNWKNYPRQMLRARVISEGVRATFPGSCAGVYTPEEVQDFTEPVKVSQPVVTEVDKPVAEEGQLVIKISDKTISKFNMARTLLGMDTFRQILAQHNVATECDITSEEEAQAILREMRLTFEKKQAEKQAGKEAEK